MCPYEQFILNKNVSLFLFLYSYEGKTQNFIFQKKRFFIFFRFSYEQFWQINKFPFFLVESVCLVICGANKDTKRTRRGESEGGIGGREWEGKTGGRDLRESKRGLGGKVREGQEREWELGRKESERGMGGRVIEGMGRWDRSECGIAGKVKERVRS